MMDASKTYLYVFDNYTVHLVDGIDAGAHKHGAYQLSISLDDHVHKVDPSADLRRAGRGHLSSSSPAATPICAPATSAACHADIEGATSPSG